MMPTFVRTALAALTVLALLGFGAVEASAQQRQITGTVTNATTSAPLSGARVLIANTNRGVQTDPQGNFTISVPAGAVQLRAALIGFVGATQTVAAGQTTANFVLAEDVLQLEGIVVTGQGTSVARRNLANAVASVSSEEIENAPTTESVEKLLQGRVAGANIETNSGAPGGGVQVRFRGVSTIIGSSEPLYVVDGGVISNEAIASNANAITAAAGGSNASTQDAVVNRAVDINPADIESVEILKGASAAALYGSRAANGVILITTKRGTPGAPRISLTQRFGFFQQSEKLGFRNWTRGEAFDFFLGSSSSAADTAFFGGFFNADGTPVQNFDNEEALAGREDLSTETIASVSGGTENTRYFISGTVKNDEGIIRNTGFQKQGVRVNLEQQLGSKLTLTANTNLLHTLAQRGVTNNDNAGVSYYMVLPFTPNFFDLRQNADGVFPDNPFERSNPLQTAEFVQNDEDVWRFIASGNADWRVFETDQHSVRLVGTAGVDFFNQDNDIFSPPILQFEDDDGLDGTALFSSSNNTNLTLTGNGVYTYIAPTGLTSTTTVGAQYGDRDLTTNRIVSQNLTAGQPNVDAGTVQQVFENRSRIKEFGVFGQEELLLLQDRLLVTAGLRADRSSVNGETDKFFVYPKAAASYRFENLVRYVDALKLRAAFGQSGNQPLYGQKFTPLNSTNNINGIPGVIVQGLTGSPDLQPERTTEFETGLDITAFGGRTLFGATIFQKDVNDVLLQRTPAPSTGFTNEIFNGGELRVRGIELSLDATPVRTDQFSWVSRTTFTRNYSKVESLPEDVPPFETGGFGTSLGAFRIEPGASATQIVANAGLDGDGNTIVAKVGDAEPTFRMGLSNELTFGPLNLYSLFDWSHGQEVINLTQFLADAGANSGDFVTNPQPLTLRDGTVVRLGDGERRITRRGNLRDSRGYIEDGSYVKLRELSLAYDLPQRFVGRVFGDRLENARLTLSGRNVVTWTDYSGLDPEVSNFGNVPIARNIDVAPFPPSRSFWLALDVTF
ncbi:TonB-dependent receptor [soil metagenome]